MTLSFPRDGRVGRALLFPVSSNMAGTTLAGSEQMGNHAVGLFRLKMKVAGADCVGYVEILEPGIATERVLQLVRPEWARLEAPGVSQNRIECLGWEPVAAPPAGLRPKKVTSQIPLVFWR